MPWWWRGIKMTENMICSCACDFKDRPFEFNVTRVRGLNKPYTRSGRVFGNILHIIDHAIGIITFGYVGSNIGSEWIRRDLDKFFQYNEDNEIEYKTGKLKFKIKRFKFKIYRVGKINKPFTRSGRVFGNVLHMIDSIIGVMTFGHFDSHISHEWTSRDLNKFGRYIEKHGVENL